MRLRAAGRSQRQIAEQLHISRPMVQRIIDSSDPNAFSGSEDDDGVIAEFEDMAKTAHAIGTLDAYRNVHSVAKVCHSNGYDVRWHSLPYLMALSAAEIDAGKRERDSLRKEISEVYQDMKDWRERQ
jgi:predicted transcriptional regulator